MRKLFCVMMLLFPGSFAAQAAGYNFTVIPTVGEEEAHFAIILKDNGNEAVRLEFPKSKFTEVKITDASGKVVYDSVRGKVTHSAFTIFTLQPGKSFILHEKWDYQWKGKRVPAGEYTVKTVILLSKVNNQPIGDKGLFMNEQKIVVPKENPSFRHIHAVGKNGDYVISGEAKAEKTFYYSVEDGHQEFLEEKPYLKNNSDWARFKISIHLSKERLPEHASLIMNLYERRKNGQMVDLYPVLLQSFD